MITTIILLLLLLDTLIGNRLFPGRTGVVKRDGYYKVYKWHRLMGIPIKLWLDYEFDENRIMVLFLSGFSSAHTFSEKTAIQKAKLFSQRGVPKKELIEVWSSHQKAPKVQDLEVLDLLGNAIREDNEPEIIRLSSLLKRS